jgi:hypothetical protein
MDMKMLSSMRLKKNMSNPRMQSLLQAKPARHLTSVAGQRHGHGYCVFYNLVKFPKTFIPKTTESFAPFPYLITTSTVSSIRQQSSC